MTGANAITLSREQWDAIPVGEFHWRSSVDNWKDASPIGFLTGQWPGVWELVSINRYTARTKFGPLEMLEAVYRKAESFPR